MNTIITHETTEQIRARAELELHISTFLGTSGRPRRAAAQQLRELARLFPWLGDTIPDDVWSAIYRVRSTGTIAPEVPDAP